MANMKFTSEFVFSIYAPIIFFCALIFGMFEWEVHKYVSFAIVFSLSIILFSFVNLLQSKVCKLEQQVTDLKKRIEALEGKK